MVVNWLTDRGIQSWVKDELTSQMLQTPQIVAPLGIEVCVGSEAEAERARELLRDHFRSVRSSHAESSKTVLATCEECGHTAEFSVIQAGTVQDCPACRKFMDVPDLPSSQ